MKYRFVLKDKGTNNQGWWLKISSIEELNKYINNVESPMVKGFKSYLHCREFASPEYSGPLLPHVNREGYFLGLYASNRQISPICAIEEIENKKYKTQVQYLLKGYNIYFNRNGCWHFGINDFDSWYDSENLVFPEFNKDQIRIEQFPMGKHFYAYIGNMQVRDGDTFKWDTYEEAYNQALSFLM